MASLSAAFTERLEAAARALEPLLEALLGSAPLVGEIVRPPRLLAAMRHAVLDGGKRLRPFLTVETARLFGETGDGPLRAGAAIELLHCYSLVHDDLPAMDDDDLRRGRPTVHRAFDEATAILAGDALLTLAFDVLADPAVTADAAVRAELVLGLARAAGLGGMVGGQMLDLEAENRSTPFAEIEVRRLQAMKTGALIAFAVDAGGVVARAGGEERRCLAAYGRALGAAFQIADDILDREASTDVLGKRAAKDADRGKATLVDVLGIEAARAERDRLAEEAVAALAPFGPAADTLRAAARFAATRRK
ncbi:polyprenyl synthetase family protein [Chelatococcus daeguensis]|uniref:polyprenyl synthetase family protein n=1 Tax=Chelatococcus daeguensis TaxID=444444 RepID=UPI0007AB768D|nr:farnesyl diphosphate synthase [Chelatococcus daeguensis]KZE35018.1 geranylgeranyl pyrophosphate synthase [Chelatococcus daeguensis]MBM3083016.1 polyprenyl synthetase family protein [Chelatococcus daeguensis]